MKIVKTKTLYFKKGTSDKVYKLHLTNDGPHLPYNYGVMVEYGRRGAKLTRHVPMLPYGARWSAEEKFDKLLKEKLGKGYTEHEPLTLTAADVGKKFKTRGGKIVTLERIEAAGRFRFDDGYWRESDGWFGGRDRDEAPYPEDVVERLPEELPVKLTVTKPVCLKTRLRKREIGRKFRTRGGLTVTLERRHAWLPGTWVWKAPNGNLFNCKADGRIHSGNGEGSLDLVERLPVEKPAKPAPKAKPKFKVGDRVKIVGKDPTGWGGSSFGKVVTITYIGGTGGYGKKTFRYRRDDGFENGWFLDCIELAPEPKRRPYPDYRKMKAALEDIRDNSPIGSDAALKAKAGLEGVEC